MKKKKKTQVSELMVETTEIYETVLKSYLFIFPKSRKRGRHSYTKTTDIIPTMSRDVPFGRSETECMPGIKTQKK